MLFKTFLKSLVLHQTHQVFYSRHPFSLTVKTRSVFKKFLVFTNPRWLFTSASRLSSEPKHPKHCCRWLPYHSIRFSFPIPHGFGASLELSVSSLVHLHPWICPARPLQHPSWEGSPSHFCAWPWLPESSPYQKLGSPVTKEGCSPLQLLKWSRCKRRKTFKSLHLNDRPLTSAAASRELSENGRLEAILQIRVLWVMGRLAGSL